MDCYVNAPRVMFHWSLAYKEYRHEVIRFALKVDVCPFTRSDDHMVLIQPILNSIIPVPASPIDEIFYVTKMTLTSIHPQFTVIIVFNKTVLNSLLMGLADGVIFDVKLNPERLYLDDTLLCIPDSIIDAEHVNAGDMIQALQEEVTGPVNQITLARTLHSHNVDAHTVLDALTEYFHDTEIRRG